MTLRVFLGAGLSAPLVSCRLISGLHEAIGNEGWCIVSGRGPEIYQVVKITGNTSLSRDEILALTTERRI